MRYVLEYTYEGAYECAYEGTCCVYIFSWFTTVYYYMLFFLFLIFNSPFVLKRMIKKKIIIKKKTQLSNDTNDWFLWHFSNRIWMYIECTFSVPSRYFFGLGNLKASVVTIVTINCHWFSSDCINSRLSSFSRLSETSRRDFPNHKFRNSPFFQEKK